MPRAVPSLATALLLAALSAACATTAERVAPARTAWERGDPGAALAFLDEVRPKVGKDWPLVDLERCSALQALGEFVPAADAAERAAQAMDDAVSPDLSSWVGAALTDDNALPWEGADHEKVLARVMASVSLLLAGEPDEARALALQVNGVQERLRGRKVLEREGDARPGYHPFAAGEYLRAVVDEGRGFFDEAALGYREARGFGFAPAAGEEERARRSRLVRGEGKGPVVVLYLRGLGPVLEERVEPVTSVVFMVASSILNDRKGSGLPSQAPVEVAWPRPRRSPLGPLSVAAAGKSLGRTETLLDVDEVAFRQAADELPRAVLRAVCRRAFKEFAKNTAKRAATDRRDSFLGFAFDLGGLIWTGVERADTRCWSFLPKRFEVARVELTEGDSILDLAPEGGVPVSLPVRVGRNRITVVLVVAPTPWAPPFAFADPRSTPREAGALPLE